MRYSQMLTAALATTLSVASPVEKRQAIDDTTVLQYALTLEYLERTFYEQALANYSQADFVKAGFADPFYKNLQTVAADEKTHVDFLTKAITTAGGKPVHQAKYSFPATDPKSFVTLSSVLEGVGVSAYLGAAGSIMNKDYLTAAGTILTVEARHTSYIRAALGESPFPAPFDTPLDFNEVFSLASAFITGFAPEDPPLPFKAFPALKTSCSVSHYTENSPVTFTGAAKQFAAKGNVNVGFFSGVTPMIVPAKVSGDDFTAMIPKNVTGQVYAVLTTSTTKPSDDNIIAGPALFEVFAAGTAPKGMPMC